MSKLPLPPRKTSMFAPLREPKDAKAVADRAENPAAPSPAKVKSARAAVKAAADRAEKKAAKVDALNKAVAPPAVKAAKVEGKPPMLDPKGKAVQLNVRLGPTMMAKVETYAKRNGMKPVEVVRAALAAFLA